VRDENNQVFENREVRLMEVQRGVRIEKDVKNEGRSDYMHENTCEVWDKMSHDESGILHENTPMERLSTKFSQAFWPKMQ